MDAYEFIRNAIIEGNYKAGQRLTEEYLAAKLNLSRTPIREAIKKLEMEGLVTPLKRGISVRTFSIQDIKQIYDLRALLEGYSASQAALFRTESDVNTLLHLNEEYTQVIERLDTLPLDSSNIKELVRINNQFHESVLVASKNNYLHFLISKVFVIPLVYRSFYWYDKHEIIQSLESHLTIQKAIQDSDPERAKVAMLEHIYRGRDHVLHHLPSNDEIPQDELD